MGSRHLNLAGDARPMDPGNTFPFITDFDGLFPCLEEPSQELDELFPENPTQADLSSTSWPSSEQHHRYCSPPLREAPHREELHSHAYNESLQLPFLHDYDVSFSTDSSHIFDIDFEMMKVDSIMDSFLSASQSLFSGSGIPLDPNGQLFATHNSSATMSVSSSATHSPIPSLQGETTPSYEMAASQVPPPASDSGSPKSPGTPASSSNASSSSAYTRTPPSIPCWIGRQAKGFKRKENWKRHMRSKHAELEEGD
ncbi:uncharacterized protein PAC_09402 [Phialocephala subalpina]|uniref:Uncharacterized protein n=1 Tax=Phialocephala subalpina TaxID=576137 RepID=A0A1L7X3B1_9HELO|nr:uncharacterized protein PAC_09402 [Phialocephala subalpina]